MPEHIVDNNLYITVHFRELDKSIQKGVFQEHVFFEKDGTVSIFNYIIERHENNRDLVKQFNHDTLNKVLKHYGVQLQDIFDDFKKTTITSTTYIPEKDLVLIKLKYQINDDRN